MSLRARVRLLRERLGLPAFVVAVAAVALCAVGLAMAASVGVHSERLEGIAGAQATRLILAVPIVAAAFWIRPRWVRANAYAFYALAVFGLVVVLAFGRVVNGSRRWLDLPAGLKLQPSDFAKLALALALARFLAARPRARTWGGIAAVLALTALPMLLTLGEPDLGTALVFVPVAAASLDVAGASRRRLAALALAAALVATPLAAFGLRGYQLQRIETWWRQDNLSPSEKLAEGYHLERSKIAIGTGGIFGQGLGEGPQNRNDLLPERHTDFILSVVAEELGLVGALAVLALELALPLGCLVIALRVREPFARIGIVGIAAQLGAQSVVNIGVATGTLPTTGIALPLVSYGGSSALVTLAGIALALNLAAHAEPVLSGECFEAAEEATRLHREIEPSPRRLRPRPKPPVRPAPRAGREARM
ncbi:MAG TPA: FtsW/RodA/SpoVE family cell cycle protein [Planctomycetota bacterium]|nr:FtsW/RodA/SpoVE family cell cycle protein [Planctomycetota bacterium]